MTSLFYRCRSWPLDDNLRSCSFQHLRNHPQGGSGDTTGFGRHVSTEKLIDKILAGHRWRASCRGPVRTRISRLSQMGAGWIRGCRRLLRHFRLPDHAGADERSSKRDLQPGGFFRQANPAYLPGAYRLACGGHFDWLALPARHQVRTCGKAHRRRRNLRVKFCFLARNRRCE